MIKIFLGVLLSSTMIGGVAAAEFDFESDIDVVTVFPQGAQVTRVAEGHVSPGAHVVIVDDLPGDVDPASIRVEGIGTGLTIGSVDINRVPLLSDGAPAERQKLESEIEALADAVALIDGRLSDNKARRGLLDRLVTQAVAAPPGEGGGSYEATAILGLFDQASERLAVLTSEQRALEVEKRDLGEKQADLYRQLEALAPTGEMRTAVAINLIADLDTEAQFAIRYGVRQAGWSAIYNASLDLSGDIDDLSVELERRANVRQTTTEAWDDIDLTLSTARPRHATSAPTLSAHILDVRPPVAAIQRSKGGAQFFASDRDVVEEAVSLEAAPEPALVQAATMETGGFQATYKTVGRSSVSNTGEEKSVLIGSDAFEADVFALSVPQHDQTAYLMAEFVNASESIYLPGPVMLTRDDVFVGRGSMPLTASGDGHTIGFGADDSIKVERIELDRRKGETGLLSTSNVDEQNHRIVVSNLHDFPMPVRVVDQMPVSNHEDITVALLNDARPADETDLDGQRGVMAWDLEPDAGETISYTFGYRIIWPAELEVSGLN